MPSGSSEALINVTGLSTSASDKTEEYEIEVELVNSKAEQPPNYRVVSAIMLNLVVFIGVSAFNLSQVKALGQHKKKKTLFD